MIDSNETKQLKKALIYFRDYISENYDSESSTAINYMQTADQFEQYAGQDGLSFDDALQGFYQLITGSPAFERPKASKKNCARALMMIADIYQGDIKHRKPS